MLFGLIDLYPDYRVSKCPVCSSEVTGRYIRKPSSGGEKIVIDGLNNNEIIKITSDYCRDRCFCLECSAEWQEYVPLTLIKRDQLAEEGRKRHIDELKAALIEPEEKEQPKTKRIFGLI